MMFFNQKNENFQDFGCRVKSKTRKSQKVLFYFSFW